MCGHYELLVPDPFGTIIADEPLQRVQILPHLCLPLCAPSVTCDQYRTPDPAVFGTWCTRAVRYRLHLRRRSRQPHRKPAGCHNQLPPFGGLQ